MRKHELKTGMVVELRGEERYQLLLNTEYGNILQGNCLKADYSSYMSLLEYHDDLLFSKQGTPSDYDIMKVFTTTKSARAFSAPFSKFDNCIWSREEEAQEIAATEAIEMLENLLGHKVKIVK